MNTSCKKFLDKKSDQKLVVPSKLADLQSLLDDYTRVNQVDPDAGESSADNFYLPDDKYALMKDFERQVYTWDKDLHFPKGINNCWSYAYDNVYRANTVLYYLDKIERTPGDQLDWNTTKGHALFIRAKAFQQLTFIFTVAFDPSTAAADLGIPLRLDPDFNTPSVRASLRQTYDRIIADFTEAASLLPVLAVHAIRPSKPAAFAMLARTFLAMRRYDKALLYADSSLQLKSDLMRYDTLNTGFNPAANYPFARFNPEVLFDAYMGRATSAAYALVDSLLYRSYADGDCRKTAFFHNNGNGTFSFVGNYNESAAWFSGIAVDEMFLARAESYVRTGNLAAGLNDLNTLMRKRWKPASFIPFDAPDAATALSIILQERRKELPFRGIRWMDIKRLNKEGAGIALHRDVNGQHFTLPPGDPRFVLPISDDVIELSGMPQNPR